MHILPPLERKRVPVIEVEIPGGLPVLVEPNDEREGVADLGLGRATGSVAARHHVPSPVEDRDGFHIHLEGAGVTRGER